MSGMKWRRCQQDGVVLWLLSPVTGGVTCVKTCQKHLKLGKQYNIQHCATPRQPAAASGYSICTNNGRDCVSFCQVIYTCFFLHISGIFPCLSFQSYVWCMYNTSNQFKSFCLWIAGLSWFDYKSGTHIATTFIKLNTELYCRKRGRGAPPVCDQDTRGGTFQVDVRHIINI